MSLIRVCLDTNILHQESLFSRRMKILRKLIGNGEIFLVLPEMVVREYKSKLIEQVSEDAHNIDKSIQSLKRKGIAAKFIEDYENIYSSKLRSETGKIEDQIDLWLKENNVEVFEISRTLTTNLFDNYFDGVGAFKKKKNRCDIPDAVIYDAVIQISRNEPLSLIVKDEHLKEQFDRLPNVRTYESLELFLAQGEIQEKLTHIDGRDSKIGAVLEYLNEYDFHCQVEEYFGRQGVNGLDDTYYDSSIELPYEFHNVQFVDLEVQAIDANEDKELCLYDPIFLEEKKFSIRIDISSKASFDMTCGLDDFEELPAKARKNLEVDLLGDNLIKVKGIIEVKYQTVLELNGIDYKIEELPTINAHMSYLGTENAAYTANLIVERVVVDDLQWL